MSQFKATPHGNEILEGDGFYISYNSRPCAGLSMFESDDGGAETALVLTNSGKTKYLIFNGDFRSEYETAAANGLDACKQVYESHKATADSSWTTRR